MPNLGGSEMAIILVIVIIIFGAGKLPEITGALGKSVREFKTNAGDEIVPSGKAKLATTEVPVTSVPISREIRSDEI
jgi:sec-independent protein translocase protein TatA